MALLIHVAVSSKLAHQDYGFTAEPYVTLPNGYVVGSLNGYLGYFTAPAFKPDMPLAGPGYVGSIVDLQFSNGDFTGTQFNSTTSRVRRFVFDTRTRAFKLLTPATRLKASPTLLMLNVYGGGQQP